MLRAIFKSIVYTILLNGVLRLFFRGRRRRRYI